MNYTTQYAYNLDNNLTSITYPTGRTVTYTLDTTGRITQVSTTLNGNAKTLASSIVYLPYGGITGLTFGNNLTLSHTYDSRYRISSIVVGSIMNWTYTYDANGNITSILDSLAATNGQGVEEARGYLYENGTNLLNDVWGSVTTQYDYDENGNTITQNNRTYVYDLSNRLITVQDDSVTIAQYVYNALNQRVKKTVSAGTRIFHYDLKGHLIAETTPAGQMIAEYVYLGDELLAIIRKPGETEFVYYFHNDHLGTPQILTDDSQNIVWKATYKPFGEAVISIETVENPFRYPGQYYDQETGLHYNWNRYYDPKTGRYLTPDPIGMEGRNNPFPFVANNPIRLADSYAAYNPVGMSDAGGSQSPVYPGAGCPSMADFFGVLRDFMLFGNAGYLIDEAARQLDEIAKTIPCCKSQTVWVCFNPGPPPRDVRVGKGERALHTPNLKCKRFDLSGTKDCPCNPDDNFYWRKYQ